MDIPQPAVQRLTKRRFVPLDQPRRAFGHIATNSAAGLAAAAGILVLGAKSLGARRKQAFVREIGPHISLVTLAIPSSSSAEVVDVDSKAFQGADGDDEAGATIDAPVALVADIQGDLQAKEPPGWKKGLGMVPPDDVRDRVRLSRNMLGREILAYVGDTVWEFMVLRHQYMQMVRSPFTESQAVRSLKQAKAAVMLFKGSLLTELEKNVLEEGAAGSWRGKLTSNYVAVEQVGHEQYSAALGLRTLLGFLYMDEKGSDDRLELIAREIGVLGEPGEEDELLGEITDGMFKPMKRQPTTFFLALAPLGHVALRLYISRYMSRRPPRHDEFIYRVKLALRAEELDLAAVGFMRDDATAEELELMKASRDQEDTYAFAFECLLGHLALNFPYRLHQVIANFGWAVPLPGT